LAELDFDAAPLYAVTVRFSWPPMVAWPAALPLPILSPAHLLLTSEPTGADGLLGLHSLKALALKTRFLSKKIVALLVAKVPAGVPGPGVVVVTTLSLPMDFGLAFVPALLLVIFTSMACWASTAEATPTTASTPTRATRAPNSNFRIPHFLLR
jgi:hypothetical protein